MRKKDFIGMLLMAFLAVAGLAACSDDNNNVDDPNPDPNPPTATLVCIFYDVEVDYAIEAKDKSGIEADLNANRPLPEEAQYGITTRRSSSEKLPAELTLNLVTEKDTVVVGYVHYGEGVDDWQKKYEILPPEKQVTDMRKWNIVSEEDATLFSYDVCIHSSIPGGNGAGGILYFYEDLTDKYKEMFPGADVTSVVRRQTLTYESKKEELQ